jgi:F-type H+-transporting ATPase subunit delta
MKNETLARVYAEALFELAVARDQLEAVHDAVLLFEELFVGERALRTFIEIPSIPSSERERVFEAALRGKVSDIALNFLLLVIRRGRQLHLLEMLDEFRALRDDKLGIVNARVSTAVPLSSVTSEALRLRLEENLKKKILLENVVDERVLGGLVVRYEGMVIDASLSKALKDLEVPLRSTKFGSEFVHEN